MTGPVEVDARGLLCPLPVLRLRKVLLSLPPGAEIRLIATDPAAAIDVPHFCAEGGHRLVSVRALADDAWEYVVARGAAATGGASPRPAYMPDPPESIFAQKKPQTGGT